jgi:type IX secretion system PorP/SprF family membrane protein
MLKLPLHIILVLFIFASLGAQENNFSQFYSSPQYLNPAFAGDALYMKVGGATRIMQPTPDSRIINSLLHFDYKIPNQHSGLGVTYFHHTEQLAHSKLQVNYSYSVSIKEHVWVKGGIGVSVNQRRSHANELQYPDQYDNYGYTGVSTAEPFLIDNSVFPGLAAGVVLYNKSTWFSLSGDYLNMPTENFAGVDSKYPLKLSFMMGMLFPIDKATSRRRINKLGDLKPISNIGPIFSVVKQDQFIEASGGLSILVNSVFGGLHYRYQHDFNVTDDSYAYKALIVMAGYRHELFSLTYSYDYSLSQYTVNKNGAHELSIIFYPSSSKKDRDKHDLTPLPNQLLY